MPYKYGGRRSKGCNLCRKRKVRCTEERPACSRCERIGKECIYRDTMDLLFHDETAHASARAERMWLSRSAPDSSDSSTRSSPEPKNGAISPFRPTPVHESVPAQSLDELVLARFMHDFVLVSGSKISPAGYNGFLPHMYRRSEPGSALALIVQAVAFANFSRRCKVPDASRAASARYGAALRLTNDALRDPATVMKHDTLLSCHLLGLYELTVPSATAFTDWNKHNQGAIALLKIRGDQQLDDPIGLAMFRQIYVQEIVSCLRYCHKPQALPELCGSALDPGQFMVYPFIVETSHVIADLLDIGIQRRATSLDHDRSLLQDTLARAQNVERRLKLLISCLPPRFAFERSKREQTAANAPRWLRRALRDPRAPEYAHKRFQSLNIANCWNWLRYCRLRLLQAQVIASLRLGIDGGVIEGKMWEMESIVDEIGSTVAYFLVGDENGEFDTSGTIEDVRGAKCFFLVRVLVGARIALEFIHRQGINVVDKLEWLGDMFELIRNAFGVEVPIGADPMDIA